MKEAEQDITTQNPQEDIVVYEHLDQSSSDEAIEEKHKKREKKQEPTDQAIDEHISVTVINNEDFDSAQQLIDQSTQPKTATLAILAVVATASFGGAIYVFVEKPYGEGESNLAGTVLIAFGLTCTLLAAGINHTSNKLIQAGQELGTFKETNDLKPARLNELESLASKSEHDAAQQTQYISQIRQELETSHEEKQILAQSIQDLQTVLTHAAEPNTLGQIEQIVQIEKEKREETMQFSRLKAVKDCVLAIDLQPVSTEELAHAVQAVQDFAKQTPSPSLSLSNELTI
eukprot:gene6819-4805_t